MTLGAGIFLSAFFLGTIFLYHSTKDRWNWKKVAKYCLYLVLLILLAIAGFSVFLVVKDKLNEPEWKNAPLASSFTYNEYFGIKLGAHTDEVLFLKGKPDRVSDGNGKTKFWTYSKDESAWHIKINQDKVSGIIISADNAYYPSDLYGIKLGASLDEIIQKLGSADEILVSEDKLSRTYNYKSKNVAFILEKGRVTSMAILDFTKDNKK